MEWMQSLRLDFEDWLYYEAELLDDLKFDEWLEYLDKDLKYTMPLRINEQGNKNANYTTNTLLFNDDYETIKMRIDRLKTDLAWAEIPPSRTRRNVANVKIQSASSTEVNVKSNLLLYRSRTTNTVPDFVSGERKDVFVKVENKWKLKTRQFIADQATISTNNLAVFV